MKNVIALCIIMASSFMGFAQHESTEISEDDAKGHSKETGIYEIITSGIYNYSPEAKHGDFGTELHFTYWFNHVWGAGLGYFVLFEDDMEKIHQLAILGSYNPTRWLTINAGPNFILPNKHQDLLVSGYFETEFNYRLRDWVHFGPLLGVVIGQKTELTTGFHLGFEF